MKLGIIIAFVLLYIRSFPMGKLINTKKQELLKWLLEDYDPSVFPGYFSEDEKTHATVQLLITDINQLDDKTMEFGIIFYLRIKWFDARLKFVANVTNVTSDRLELSGNRVNTVWTPDLFFRTERKTASQGVLGKETLVYIKPEGQVYYSERLSVTSICAVDLDKYPFDTQKCDLQIISYTYTYDELVLFWADDSPVTIEKEELQFFNAKVDGTPSSDILQFGHSLIPGRFSMLRTTIKFERERSSYATQYVYPYPVFMSFALASFGTKDIHTRLTACSGAMASTVLQWIQVYSNLPAVVHISHLDKWVVMHITIICLIFVYHVAVSRIKDIIKTEENPKSVSATDVETEENLDSASVTDVETEENPESASATDVEVDECSCNFNKGCCRDDETPYRNIEPSWFRNIKEKIHDCLERVRCIADHIIQCGIRCIKSHPMKCIWRILRVVYFWDIYERERSADYSALMVFVVSYCFAASALLSRWSDSEIALWFLAGPWILGTVITVCERCIVKSREAR